MYLTCDIETTKEDHITSKHWFFLLGFLKNVSTGLCEGRCKCMEQQSSPFFFLSKGRTEPVLQSGVLLSYCRKGKKKLRSVVDCCFTPIA